MDPRQRSSDLRYFKAIGAFLLVGAGLCLVPVVLWQLGADVWEGGHGRRGVVPPIAALPAGAAIILYCLGDLIRRAIRGPDKPGKRARY